jgi:hypothetical protein
MFINLKSNVGNLKNGAYGAKFAACSTKYPAYGSKFAACGAKYPAYGAKFAAWGAKYPAYGAKFATCSAKDPRMALNLRYTRHAQSAYTYFNIYAQFGSDLRCAYCATPIYTTG